MRRLCAAWLDALLVMSNNSSPVMEKKKLPPSPLDNGSNETPTTTPNHIDEENDPCLKTSLRKNGDARKFHARAEEWLRERSGLSRKGLLVAGALLLLLLVLVLVVITLAACWPRTPHHRQFPVCENVACLRAVAQIREGLNTSESPCHDVVSWSCGSWLQAHTVPPQQNHWSRREQLYKEETARMRSLISSIPFPLEPKSVHWKVKHLYDTCMQMDNVNSDGYKILLKEIDLLDGWKILRSGWSLDNWDYRRTLNRLHTKYGVTPFFRISVVPHPRSPSTNIIKIAPAGLGLPDRSFYYLESENEMVAAYTRFIRDVVTIFGAETSNAGTFSNNMFHFEKRLAEITPTTASLENGVIANIITVSELKIQAHSLPIDTILETMFPKGKITHDTDILVPSLEYLTAVSELISTTDRGSLNNYFIWTLAREYIPYLSSDLLSNLQEYKAVLTGARKPLERWESCVAIVRKFIGLASEAMLDVEKHLTEHDIKVINEMFEAVRIAAKVIVEEMDYPTELEKHLKFKLSSMSLQVGLPTELTHETYLTTYYEKLFIQRADFFSSVSNSYEFIKLEQQERYVEPKSEDRLIPYFVVENPTVAFSLAANTLIVPKIFLKDPFFNSRYPRSINYGRLGLEMAKAVASSLFPYGSTWTAGNGLLTPYHPAYNESMTSVEEPISCLMRFVLGASIIAQDISNITTLHTFVHLNAVNIAHRALVISLNDDEHIHQPTLERYEDSAIFFMTYTQEQCSKYLKQYEFVENNVNFKLSDMQLINVAWLQVEGFPKALECENNASQQCL